MKPYHQCPKSRSATTNEPITFTEEDALKVNYPHIDPSVVIVLLGNMKVHRTLVDNGSSINILYQSALEKMGLKICDLKPSNKTLYGFTGDSMQPLGSLQLALTVRDFP